MNQFGTKREKCAQRWRGRDQSNIFDYIPNGIGSISATSCSFFLNRKAREKKFQMGFVLCVPVYNEWDSRKKSTANTGREEVNKENADRATERKDGAGRWKSRNKSFYTWIHVPLKHNNFENHMLHSQMNKLRDDLWTIQWKQCVCVRVFFMCVLTCIQNCSSMKV